VLNGLESIEAVISNEEGERKACRRECTLGSNRGSAASRPSATWRGMNSIAATGK
jgi:hypothetical protein